MPAGLGESEERGKFIYSEEKYRKIPGYKITDMFTQLEALVISVVGWREGKIELTLIMLPSSTPASNKIDNSW